MFYSLRKSGNRDYYYYDYCNCDCHCNFSWTLEGIAPPPAATDTAVADVVIMAAGPAFTKTHMRIELIGNWK